MAIRLILAVIIGAFLSFHSLRTAAVSWRTGSSLISLEKIWPTHPLVISDRIMANIGRDARSGEPQRGLYRERLRHLARKAPLAVEPFLIEGALAEMDGRGGLAEKLFSEARYRDPRSPAARYFLGSRYLATDRIPDGLKEIAVVTRLVPGAEAQFVPALAAYARSPGAVPRLRRFFQSSPQTEDAVLTQLSADASNADLVLALASPRAPDPAQTIPVWHSALVGKLVEQGQYEKAHAIWARLGGAPPARTLFNPTFRKLTAIPPFNWAFDAGKAGVAEPSENGLKIVYYGRDDAVLASQLLVLRAGTYQLTAPAQGARRIDGLAWSLSCQPGKRTIATMPITGSATASSRFSVPASGCGAQYLELKASSSEGAQPVELSIPRLDLAKASDQ